MSFSGWDACSLNRLATNSITAAITTVAYNILQQQKYGNTKMGPGHDTFQQQYVITSYLASPLVGTVGAVVGHIASAYLGAGGKFPIISATGTAFGIICGMVV